MLQIVIMPGPAIVSCGYLPCYGPWQLQGRAKLFVNNKVDTIKNNKVNNIKNNKVDTIKNNMTIVKKVGPKMQGQDSINDQ